MDTVAFKDIHPPVSVAPQFEAVISAEEEREAIVNQAEAIRNRIIPLARAEAERKLAEAGAYRTAVIGKARGTADRFRLRRPKDESVAAVQRLRIRRKAQIEGLKKPAKILVGPGCERPGVLLVPAGAEEMSVYSRE